MSKGEIMSQTDGEKQVNQTDVETSDAEYTQAASYLKADFLASDQIDSKSTITANEKSYMAYTMSEVLLESLGEKLDTEAQNIRATGLEFKEYDEMMASFFANGERVKGD